jgi:ribosomal protein S13
MRVKQLVNAFPGYGFKRTQALMRELGIAENKRVGGLGSVQAANLIMKLDGVEQ